MAYSYPDPRGATVLYKILTSAEAEGLPSSPSTDWHGSSLDIKDGFLHASTVHQLPITLQRFFTPENPEVGDTVHIYAMHVDRIPEGKLRWDEIKSGEVFGHVYGSPFTDKMRSYHGLSYTNLDPCHIRSGINPVTDFSFHRTYHRNSQGLFELDADLPF